MQTALGPHRLGPYQAELRVLGISGLGPREVVVVVVVVVVVGAPPYQLPLPLLPTLLRARSFYSVFTVRSSCHTSSSCLKIHSATLINSAWDLGGGWGGGGIGEGGGGGGG